LNNSLLTVPDGKPLEFRARMKGYAKTRTVSGYWLIKSLLTTNHTHFFYGADGETTGRMKMNLMREFPDAGILGFASPPLLNLPEITGNDAILKDMHDIAALKPDFIWIGISSPKQEYLMHYFSPVLQHGVMLGVGGVFDYLSGDHKKSPEWIKTIGLRWLYRMVQAPRRLWKKYYFILRTMIRLLLTGKHKDHFVS
jgi:N-acetylglucosaminyldiphosphoundecaprenol N-acetyl-beta-D-mannosaminyltransferase